MKPTLTFRHVWRILNDGNGEIKVLTLQQWYKNEGWEHSRFDVDGGSWEDIEVSIKEPSKGPEEDE